MAKSKKKEVWSIRVTPELKEWFSSFAKKRCTNDQEEARRALADFRDRQIEAVSKK